MRKQMFRKLCIACAAGLVLAAVPFAASADEIPAGEEVLAENTENTEAEGSGEDGEQLPEGGEAAGTEIGSGSGTGEEGSGEAPAENAGETVNAEEGSDGAGTDGTAGEGAALAEEGAAETPAADPGAEGTQAEGEIIGETGGEPAAEKPAEEISGAQEGAEAAEGEGAGNGTEAISGTAEKGASSVNGAEQTIPAAKEQTIKEKESVKKEKAESDLTPEEIAGTWSVDGYTSFRFGADGQGALVLPSKSYKFRFKLKEDKIVISFYSGRAHDTVFTISVTDGVLCLSSGEQSYDLRLEEAAELPAEKKELSETVEAENSAETEPEASAGTEPETSAGETQETADEPELPAEEPQETSEET